MDRWLPSWAGLLKQNGDTGYLVGPSLTQADVAVWDAIDTIATQIPGAEFGPFESVERFHENIGSRPGIAAYLASDRRLEGLRPKE